MSMSMSKKIEDKLNVICVISNPCNYKRRIELAKTFINHMLETKNVNLFVVECIYPKLNQQYKITDKDNPNHLQLTADTILWTKENMINVAVKKLLPSDYKAFAFLDADLHFNNQNWAEETLIKLNSCDILQPFHFGYNLNNKNELDQNPKIMYSWCYYRLMYGLNKPRKPNNPTKKSASSEELTQEAIHPGWAWAMTRTAYEKMGGLYDLAIVGGGDTILAKSIMNNNYMNTDKPYVLCSPYFRKSLYDYQQRCLGLKFGYTSGVVHHNYHGSLQNRHYTDRWQILIFNNYNPYYFLTRNECGMYKASPLFPPILEAEIMNYFRERNEDNS